MKKKIKILHTLNNGHISGIENFVLLVLKHINREYYDLTVAIPFRGNICQKLDELQIPYFVYSKRNKVNSIIGTFNILKLMLNVRFDIIHANAGIIPCLLGKLLHPKLIVEHKHGLDFSYEKRNNIKGVDLFKEKLKKYFVDITLTGCESDRKYLIDVFGYSPSEVVTLYNGIESMNINSEYNKKEAFVIGTIGRLTYQKGHEYFIQMAKLINDEIKDNNFIFEIWGEGSDKLKLNSLIKDMGLSEKVLLKGYANEREKVYTKFDLFVLTSRYEGIPFVILEAMQAKLPIISTDVGGINEIIRSNYNGILVEKNNPSLLKEAVIKLYKNKFLSEALRKNAYMDYINLWSFDKTIGKLEYIYKSYGT